MIRSKIHALIAAVIFIHGTSLSAQSEDLEDQELWVGAQFCYKPNKKWVFGLEQQLRRKDNFKTTDQYFTEANLKHYISKNMYLGLGGRYISKNDTKGKKTGYEKHVRLNADLGYKHKLDAFKFYYRVRLQGKNERNVSELEGDKTEHTLRFKASTLYAIKKWPLDPKVSAELFNDLGVPASVNQFRITIGTNYQAKHFGEFGLFYRFQRQVNRTPVLPTHIFGMRYKYTLKRKK